MIKPSRELGEFPWRQGWWQGADGHRASPHEDARPEGSPIDLLVVHSISLPPGEFGGPAVDALFMGTLDVHAHPSFAALEGLRVSAHFVIRRDGRCIQYVSCLRRAWHAGLSHWRGRERCNDFSIGVELEGLEGGAFEPAQYAALVRLTRALAMRFGLAHVVGHEHVAPTRKADPGAGFDWAFMQRELGWPPAVFAPGVLADASLAGDSAEHPPQTQG